MICVVDSSPSHNRQTTARSRKDQDFVDVRAVQADLICQDLLRPLLGSALIIGSAVWLPLNNRHLEGPVLLAVDARHGLTAMDL